MLQSSKDEARLAVDLHNRLGQRRQIEAFVVHMMLAWLKMLQATYMHDGRARDLYELDRNSRRQRTAEGDWRMKPLSALLRDTYSDTSAVRRNVEFFLGLRHKIEHRFDAEVATIVAGKVQALILNYERELVATFGENEGLAEELRFPVFVGSITADAVETLKSVRARTPRSVLDYIEDFDATLDPSIARDTAYDFRVVLIPQTGPKSEADVAMSFVRLEDLNDEQRTEVDRALTIIREKLVPVQDYGALLPAQVVERVRQEGDASFSMVDHTRCWKHYEVRPARAAEDPTKTKSEYCRYNSAFNQYVYTDAWVRFVIRKLQDDKGLLVALGRA